MNDPSSVNSEPSNSRLSLRTVLKREWPYLLVVALALFGIAYTTVSRAPMALYWIALVPLIGVVCVLTRWRDIHDRDERLRLVWTQALHWIAVLPAVGVVGRPIPDLDRLAWHRRADRRLLPPLRLG
jgi:hypothetical protein